MRRVLTFVLVLIFFVSSSSFVFAIEDKFKPKPTKPDPVYNEDTKKMAKDAEQVKKEKKEKKKFPSYKKKTKKKEIKVDSVPPKATVEY